MTRISLCLFAAVLAAGCQSSAQHTFKSPEAAVDSLVSALRAGDTAQLDQIFGKDGAAIVSSGDPVADRNDFAKFVQAYDAKHELSPAGDGEMMLTIGNDDWPFPAPIVKDDKGWVFDSAAGKDEILNRRIGRNELSTMQVCLAIVDAQREYARLDPGGVGLPVYARRIISEPGKKNGLYWPTAEGAAPSPLGPLVAHAADEGYAASRDASGEPAPYHGYRYRLLTSQGPHARGGAMDYVIDGRLISGFGLLAYPAEYGSSGIMTFMVNHEGTVYQKDLGQNTEQIARSISAFDPGEGWAPCEKPQE
jgi:hypothetical protein